MIQTGNLFARRSDPQEDEIKETILDKPDCRIERIVSQGQASPPGFWYDQPHDEWVIILQGAARISFEEEFDDVELAAGDYVYIPAHLRHRVAWTAPNLSTVWLAVHC